MNVPIVATNNVRFLMPIDPEISPSDFEAHEARVCIQRGEILDDPRRSKDYIETQYFRTKEEMLELFSDLPEALLNSVKIAEKCNVDNITAHLREDRRHVNENDIKSLLSKLKIPLYFEMAATSEMINFAVENLPYACCIVPEKRQEITTEGGLNLKSNKEILDCINKLKDAGILCSLFIDPDIEQISLASEIGADAIEIHTGKYCDALNESIMINELENIKKSAIFAKSKGLDVHAGHGLNYKNISEIAKIEEITEVNIGHFLIGEAIKIGITEAILKMRSIIDDTRKEDV